MARAARAAGEAGFRGILATPGPDLLYLTGYAPVAVTERLTLLIVPADGDPTLIVPTLERPDAEAAPAAERLIVRDWGDGSDPYRLAAGVLDAGGRYAISDSAWALQLLGLQAQLPGTGFAPLTTALPMLRAVKDADELQRLAAAATAADLTYGEILSVRFAGRRENEVARDLADLLTKHGHSQVDFTVVGSGPNGANPHHEAGDRVMRVGDTVVLDFGGLKAGYGSDTTRTVSIGEPSAEVRHVHEVVRQAQEAAFVAVYPGVTCEAIDRVARQVITEAGYGPHFVHRTGHGIGLTTHEPPYIVEGEKQPLEPGMCFSIEPGVYLPGHFGVRIEDIVTVTRDGGQRLNETSHALAVVD
ncbi:aminopeptidase P family protein [Cryptosporangium minutisporangium]